MTGDHQLLSRYALENDESAFAELVTRHVNLVYSTALRQLTDVELAKDAAQIVFSDLAKKSCSFSGDAPLPGWLYRHTCFVASKLRRAEARRKRREQAMIHQPHSVDPSDSGDMISILDDAIQRLKAEDRDAVVLRFFKGSSFAEIGRIFGIKENAARMRIDRALERLQSILSKRGITSTSSAIAAVLSTSSTQAPAGLSAAITTSAALKSLAASQFSATLLQMTTMTKLKMTLGAMILTAGISVPLLMQQNVAQLRSENTQLHQQVSDVAELRRQVEQLSQLKLDTDELERLRRERGELFRLRSEVGMLRQQLQQVRQAHAESGNNDDRTAGTNSVALNEGAAVSPGYYDAASWADSGFSSPQNSTLTFLWALRTGHAQQYSEALGKTNLMALPVEWASALGKVKGSQISDTITESQGELTVAIVHQLEDGTKENSWLGFHNVDGTWRVKRMTGYPIKVFAASADER